MKFSKKRNRWEASNWWFDPKTQESMSYNWWYISKRIGGTLFFNNYSYSASTRKHQTKTFGKITGPYVVVEMPDLDKPESGIEWIKGATESINKQQYKGRRGSMAFSFRRAKLERYALALRELQKALSIKPPKEHLTPNQRKIRRLLNEA